MKKIYSLFLNLSKKCNVNDITIKIIKATIPIAGANIMDFAFGLVDSAFVARRGATIISAVEVATQIMFCLNYIILGIVSGNSIFLARLFGNKVSIKREVNDILGYSLRITLSACCLFIIFCSINPMLLLSFFSKDSELLEFAASFLVIYSMSWFWLSISLILINVLRCNHNNKIVLYISILIVFLKILLSFIFYKIIDIKGLALATLIARCIECFLYVTVIINKKEDLCINIKQILLPKKNLKISYLEKIIPIITNEVMWSFGFSIVSIILAQMGVSAIAAYSIYNLSKKISGFIGQALITTCSIFMGNIIGMGNKEKIFSFKNYILKITRFISVFTGVFTIFIGNILLKVYLVDANTMKSAVQFIYVGSIIEFFRIKASMNMIGILRAGADTKFVLINDILFMWLIEIPIGYILISFYKVPVVVLFFILNIEHIFKYLTSNVRLQSNKWLKEL